MNVEPSVRLYGKVKRAMASLPVGGVIAVRGYRDAKYPAGRPSSGVYRYARLYGYTMEVEGYAETDTGLLAYVRRVA